MTPHQLQVKPWLLARDKPANLRGDFLSLSIELDDEPDDSAFLAVIHFPRAAGSCESGGPLPPVI